MKVNLFAIFILIFVSLPIMADDNAVTPSLSAISSLAKAAVSNKLDVPANAKVDITPQNLDSRLTPPRCLGPVVAELASDREIGRNNTVKLSCDSPDLAYPWQVYISVRVDILFPVVVANEILSAGELISDNQISVRYVEQSTLRGQQFNDTSEITGTRVKRRVAKDAPIFANNLCFVCKGDAVSIYARTANLTIKTLGEALSDGNLNDTIRVKNANSNKQLDARVTGIGEVEVRM